MTYDEPIRLGVLLDSAVTHAVPVVCGVDEESFSAATPCDEYDVRALLNHLFHVVVNFRALAAKQPADFSTAPDYVAEADWRARFEAETRKLVTAWSAPGAEDGTTGLMDMPARTVGSMVLLDLTVHAWDVARATGAPFEPAPAVVAELAKVCAEMAPMGRRMNVFAEAVIPPADASAFEHLLATTGRDPLT
ncbi:TIGR03086 family metal-binding protein [Streptomyces tanashiensis]|uniref:TIGR03086 family metal-binding protein n=1 Tax=Streptomyces tanashiensis TaxID=67367 RepID=UPI00340ACF45